MNGSTAAFTWMRLAVGILQKVLYWVIAGRYFNAEETRCIACGDSAYTIILDKTPMS